MWLERKVLPGGCGCVFVLHKDFRFFLGKPPGTGEVLEKLLAVLLLLSFRHTPLALGTQVTRGQNWWLVPSPAVGVGAVGQRGVSRGVYPRPQIPILCWGGLMGSWTEVSQLEKASPGHLIERIVFWPRKGQAIK